VLVFLPSEAFLGLLSLNKLKMALLVVFWLQGCPHVEAGSVRGEVNFSGTPPWLQTVPVTKDQDYCGQHIPNESYIFDPRGGFKNAVVFIDHPSNRPERSARENVLDSYECRFVPHVLAMMMGERLIIKNSDPKLHMVHSYLEQRTVFNISLPFRGQRINMTHKIRKPGVLQVNCDTHAWMRGYIYVFDHPFFALTNELGAFSIPNIAGGKYILKAWHEDAGTLVKEILVPEEGELKVNFAFKKK
jgi:hypothetical protein